MSEETSHDTPCQEEDGCPTELAVLQREWRLSRSVKAKLDLDTVAYIIYLETWLGRGKDITFFNEDELSSLHKKWVTEWQPARSRPHDCGDSSSGATCLRCTLDEIYADARRVVHNVNYKGD